MPHKPKPNPYSGITNPYSNADGLMHNSVAENVIQANIAKANSSPKKCNLCYGMTYEKSTVKWSAKTLNGDLTVTLFREDGTPIDRSEWERAGKKTSGVITEGKREYREVYS